MARHSIRTVIVQLYFNGEAMPQYEVTTTVTITRVYTVDADGEETAKEQAEEMTFANISRDISATFANADVDQNVVQYITRDEDYKLHT